MIYNLYDLYFEVTRRCNMQCKHCMRGPLEKVDMPKEYVDAMFKQLNGGFIGQLTLGGGEPTLNPELINYIVDKIIKDQMAVHRVSMITNGKEFNKDVADAFNRIEDYIRGTTFGKEFKSNPSQLVRIAFSTDPYHQKMTAAVRKQYEKSCKNVGFEDHCVSDDRILKTGLSTFGQEYTYWLPNEIYIHRLFEPTALIQGLLYLTATGYLTSNGEGSYIDMDELNYGHITELSLDDVVQNYFMNTDSFFREENLGKTPERVMRRHQEAQ